MATRLTRNSGILDPAPGSWIIQHCGLTEAGHPSGISVSLMLARQLGRQIK